MPLPTWESVAPCRRDRRFAAEEAIHIILAIRHGIQRVGGGCLGEIEYRHGCAPLLSDSVMPNRPSASRVSMQ